MPRGTDRVSSETLTHSDPYSRVKHSVKRDNFDFSELRKPVLTSHLNEVHDCSTVAITDGPPRPTPPKTPTQTPPLPSRDRPDS